jgi:hypothetical protein
MARQEALGGMPPCPDCLHLPCKNPQRQLDDCCACSGEVCGDSTCPAIELIVCEVCGIGDREEELMLCDGCDHACHLDCLNPPRSGFPALFFCKRCQQAAGEKRSAVNRETSNSLGGQSLKARRLDPGPLVSGCGDFFKWLDENKQKFCNCRKSRCLKQYCECFRGREWCNQRCNCIGCLNQVTFSGKSLGPLIRTLHGALSCPS